MKTTFVSTPAIANSARISLMRMQDQLATLSTGLSTGRHPDIGLELGHQTGRVVSLRSEHSKLSQLLDTNSMVSTRLESTQATITGLTERTEAFIDILVASRDAGVGRFAAIEDARDALSVLISQLNTSLNGEFTFAGINSDLKPIADYFASPTSSAKLAVDSAFFASFGMSQNDPAVSAITAADMSSFLDVPFAALFDTVAWTSDWSAASNQNVANRIAPDTQIEGGTNANIEAFRKLAMAFTMMADLGGDALNDGALQVVADRAVILASEAMYQLAREQGEIGIKQQRIEHANGIMSVQIGLLESEIGQLESTDPFESTTRINELISQIEVSYAVTGRLQQLSLVRFL